MRLPRATAFTKRQTIAFISVLLIAITVLITVGFGLSPGTLAAGSNQVQRADASDESADNHGRIANAYGKLPISFASNQGQTDGRVRFTARGLGYSLFLTADEAVLALRSGARTNQGTAGLELPDTEPKSETSSTGTFEVVRMKLIGANKKARINGLNEFSGKLNYFIGNDSSQWRRNIPTYSQVRYSNTYPGIDLVYHGNQEQLEYDFVVAPGASPRRIKLDFEGIKKIGVDSNGDLLLSTATGVVRQQKPIAYQEINGERREVAATYRLRAGKVGFDIGSYDKTRTLIIDPVLVY